MPTPVVCERHGVSYDAERDAACPECRASAAQAPPEGTRPSQLDTKRREPVGPISVPRDASTTRRLEGKTTANGRHRSGRPATQRPRVTPVIRRGSVPPNPRWYAAFGLGWLALTGVVVYRLWSAPAPEAAAPEPAPEAAAEPSSEEAPAAEAKPVFGGPSAPDGVSMDTASPSAAPSRHWPPIRQRGRPGELPQLCSQALAAAAESGGSPDRADQSALLRAASSGPLEALQHELEAGADLEARGSLQRTALMAAARAGRQAHVQALLLAGADARAQGLWDAQGGAFTAVDAALLGDHTETIQLIQRDILQSFVALDPADLSALDPAGNTPLHWVARHADAAAARLLLERGADREARNCPARPGDERGPHQDDLRAATPLLVALWAGNTLVARQLLEAKADAGARDERGRGVFHLLRDAAAVALSAELLKAGADPERRDRDGQTPLDALSALGLRSELLRALTAAGHPLAAPAPTAADLFALLQRIGRERSATQPEDPAPVRALLENDALLVSEVDAQGRTALFEAAAQGLPQSAELMVARGGDVNARDRAGRSALHLARDGGTVRTLVRLGASVDVRDGSGATPLLLHAATPGSLEIVRALLEAGANPRLLDARQHSASALARSSGSPEVADYLERQL